MLAALSSLVLLALLLAAVGTDLRSGRVPNRLVLCGTAIALLVHALALGGAGEPLAGATWWAPVAGFVAGLASLLPLYLLRAMGAGDVKLMAMVGAFVGVPTVFMAILYTLLAGGLLCLAVMAGRGVAGPTLANLRFLLTDWAVRLRGGQGLTLAPLEATAARLPYALAIGLGTVAALVVPIARP